MSEVHLDGSWCGIYGICYADDDEESTCEGGMTKHKANWTGMSAEEVATELESLVVWLRKHKDCKPILFYNQ